MINLAWIALCGLLLTGSGLSAPWRAAELGHSNQSAWTEEHTTEYRDAATFKAAWSQLFPVAAFRPALPAVDFRSWRVVIVAIGNRPSGGYSARLDSGSVVHDTAMLSVAIVTPPRGCAVSMELTAPAVAIALPAAPAPFRVVIHERADTARCN